jgi:hypothetical protein
MNHVTLGAELLAILQTMRSPEALLGEEWIARQRQIHPKNWYPVTMAAELFQQLSRRLDRGALVEMGRQLFRDSHHRRLIPHLRSVGDVVFGLNGIYHRAHRGKDIGGWEVLRFDEGRALLRKTTPTPCALEEGLLCEALHSVGAEALVVQPTCVQHGGRYCDFEISSSLKGDRWLGTHGPI